MAEQDENVVPAKKPRFASVNTDVLEKILKDKDSANTKKATARSMRLFTKYIQEKCLDIDIDTCGRGELDTILTTFYAEARNKEGESYKSSTLKNTRYGLNRYFTETRNIDILKDREFDKSNKMYSAMSVQLKREGLGGIDHYPPIDEDHLKEIYDSLTDIDPVSLQHKIFVDVLLYFGRRGRENLRDLKKCDFEVCTKKSKQGGGDVELTYIRIKKDELTKNHRDDNNTAVGKMYEVTGMYNLHCIQLFERVCQLSQYNLWIKIYTTNYCTIILTT